MALPFLEIGNDFEVTEQTVALDGEQFYRIPTNVSEWLNRGLLVRIRVFGAEALRVKLNPVEVGLYSPDAENTEANRKHMEMGSKILAPAIHRRLHTWATRCRQILPRYGLDLEAVKVLTGASSWRLVLFDSYPAMKEAVAVLSDKTREDSVLRQILDDYERDYALYEAEARTYFHSRAEDAWTKIRSRYPEAMIAGDAVTAYGPDQKEDFVADLTEAALKSLPTPDELRDKVSCYMNVSAMFVDVQHEIEQNITARQLRRDRDQQIVDLRADMDSRHVEHQRMIDEARDQMRQELMRLRPDAEIRQRVMSVLAEGLTRAIQSYRKNGSFLGQSLSPIAEFPQLFKMLGGQYLDDDELNSLIDALSDKAIQYRNDGRTSKAEEQIITAMAELGEICEKQLTIAEEALKEQGNLEFLEF